MPQETIDTTSNNTSSYSLVNVAFISVIYILLCVVMVRSPVTQKQDGYQVYTTAIQKPVASPTPTPWVYNDPTHEQQTYILALGAILSQYNREDFTTLNSGLNLEGSRQTVKDSWGVTDRQSALDALNWLRDEGHRQEVASILEFFQINAVISADQLVSAKMHMINRLQGYRTEANLPPLDTQRLEQNIDFVWNHKNELQNRLTYAWDFGRLVNVARWCYSYGWITEQEAWTYMVPAAQKLQTMYHSWEDYGDAYLLGRMYWIHDERANLPQKSVELFLLTAPYGAWTKIDWNTDLH